MPITDFQVERELGRGAFATVYRCRRKHDGRLYALKKINMGNLPSKDRVNALNEIRILASVSGPNIIEYKQAFYDQQSSCLCIIMEYANDGDIISKINKHKEAGTMFEEREIWKTAYDILKGLKVLHTAKILHRDIKSANIFVSEGVAKIGDLNISKLLHNDMATTQTGTPYYTCPEVWKDQPYSFKGDVWSFGCVIYEMCMLKPPFRAQQFEGLYQKVTQGIYDKISFVYSSSLNMFIARCLTVDNNHRASVNDLLNSHFFREFNGNAHKKKSIEMGVSPLLETMVFPENLAEINNIMPGPQYEKKNKKKPKTVMIMDNHDQDIKQIENNFTNTLEKIDTMVTKKGARSEKLLPPMTLPVESKSHKFIGEKNEKTFSPIKTALRIRKPLKCKLIL